MIHHCSKCETILVEGSNWMASLVKRRKYTCTTCYNIKEPKPKPEMFNHSMAKHNMEMHGEAKAQAMAVRKARIEAQLADPAIQASLSKNYSTITTTVVLKAA